MTDVERTRIEPEGSEAAAPFWEGTKERRYLVQWCTAPACDAPIFYPRDVCPRCLSADSLTWRESKGVGVVHAVSVQHRAANPLMAGKVPYAVALVELDAGIRVMSNVVNCDPSSVNVGDPVMVTWEPLSDGRNLPLFEPAKER